MLNNAYKNYQLLHIACMDTTLYSYESQNCDKDNVISLPC